MEIRDNLMHPVKTIEDRERVMRVLAFINARRSGWRVPWYGAPVPTIIADLYRDEEFVGHFGAGTNFFACHREGEFYSLMAEPSELVEFEALVGAKREKPPVTK